ncbi:hypothetical protein B0J17DRAFT_389535 [Rhizoctonia solani]|nr:hypothetical protein B0J17DRAFT_389535 [Rhizoctonia solani]
MLRLLTREASLVGGRLLRTEVRLDREACMAEAGRGASLEAGSSPSPVPARTGPEERLRPAVRILSNRAFRRALGIRDAKGTLIYIRCVIWWALFYRGFLFVEVFVYFGAGFSACVFWMVSINRTQNFRYCISRIFLSRSSLFLAFLYISLAPLLVTNSMYFSFAYS